MLQTMLNLASHYRVGIGVVRSGHPLDVVGTSRPSNHPIGLAFDTWRIDDQPVVAATTPRALVMAYRQAAASLGSCNVGARAWVGILYGTGLTSLSTAFALSFWLGLAMGALAGELWLRSTPPATA